MMLNQRSYIKAYRKYASSLLNKCTRFIQIGKYAHFLTKKANELIQRAETNKEIDLPSLQKSMFEEGSNYIKKFSAKFRNKRPEFAEAKSEMELQNCP